MRTRLTLLVLAALLALAGAAPALADPGHGDTGGPGHAEPAGPGGSTRDGPGSGPGGGGSTGSGSGGSNGSTGSGSDDDRVGGGGRAPSPQPSAERPPAPVQTAPGPGPSNPTSTPSGAVTWRSAPSGASMTRRPAPGGAPATRRPAPDPAHPGALEPRPPLSSTPVGSVAHRRSGGARLSTAPDPAAVAGVAAGVLALAVMVAAGFRARSRLGRLG